jgi:hypothetical protein
VILLSRCAERREQDEDLAADILFNMPDPPAPKSVKQNSKSTKRRRKKVKKQDANPLDRRSTTPSSNLATDTGRRSIDPSVYPWLAILSTIILAVLLGGLTGYRFNEIQHERRQQRSALRSQLENFRYAPIAFTQEAKSKLEKQVEQLEKLKAELDDVEPLVFKDANWRPDIIAVLGLNFGIAAASFWPIGLCIYGSVRNRIQPNLILVLCLLAGGMIWQARSGYIALADERHTDAIFDSVVGGIVGAGGGFLIGLFIVVLMRRREAAVGTSE